MLRFVVPAAAALGLLCVSSPARAEPAKGAPVCVIDSPHARIDLVTVTPKDGPPFPLALDKVRVVARPTDVADAPVPIEVLGPIHFRGLATIEAYAPTRPVVRADGMLRAGRGSRLVRGVAKGGTFEGSMQLGGGFILVEHVAVPCTALEVPAEDSIPEALDDPQWGIDGGDKPVEFWSLPGRGARIEVWPGLPFHRVETRGKWTLMAVRFSDGSALHGWVDTATVSDDAYGMLVGGIGFGCGGSYYSDRIIGPATVRAGTRVSATPGGAPWGDVPRDAKMRVELIRGEDRAHDIARIDDVDGYRDELDCSGLSHAYIPASSFEFDKD